MESRLGFDFSRVRVRESSADGEAAGARAWATQDEITFARGLCLGQWDGGWV